MKAKKLSEFKLRSLIKEELQKLNSSDHNPLVDNLVNSEVFSTFVDNVVEMFEVQNFEFVKNNPDAVADIESWKLEVDQAAGELYEKLYESLSYEILTAVKNIVKGVEEDLHNASFYD